MRIFGLGFPFNAALFIGLLFVLDMMLFVWSERRQR
jgi:hypothetical protein